MRHRQPYCLEFGGNRRASFVCSPSDPRLKAYDPRILGNARRRAYVVRNAIGAHSDRKYNIQRSYDY